MLTPMQAQPKTYLKTYLNLEAGPHWSMIQVQDPGHYFEKVSAPGAISGLSIEQEIIPELSISTGVYFQQYKTGISMEDSRRFQAQSPSFSAIMIPLRVQYRIQPTEYPLSFSPRLGYMYSMNTLPDELFSIMR